MLFFIPVSDPGALHGPRRLHRVELSVALFNAASLLDAQPLSAPPKTVPPRPLPETTPPAKTSGLDLGGALVLA